MLRVAIRTTLLVVMGAGCSSSDEDLAQHLVLTLGAGTMFPEQVTLALDFEARGDSLALRGHPIGLTSNGRELSVPFSENPPRGRIHDTCSDTYFAHFTHDALTQWLGGPGKHEIVARCGPVSSNTITIALPEMRIDAPTLETVQHLKR